MNHTTQDTTETTASKCARLASNNDIDELRVLILEHAPELYRKNAGGYSLYVAASEGHFECVHALLDLALDIYEKTKNIKDHTWHSMLEMGLVDSEKHPAAHTMLKTACYGMVKQFDGSDIRNVVNQNYLQWMYREDTISQDEAKMQFQENKKALDDNIKQNIDIIFELQNGM
jgi:hypothetical protein